MQRTTKILPILFIILLIGSVLIHPPLARGDFALELDASYMIGTLGLNFTICTPEPTMWTTYLILLGSIQVIHLWTVPLPVVDPSIELPISIPFPSVLREVVIWTGLFTAEGAQAIDFAWIATHCWDGDGDGYKDETCGGTDCDDSDLQVNPGADEVCDTADWDCSGDPFDKDSDGDGHIDDDPVCMGEDCDDSDPDTYPGADEICDGKDSDCDGTLPAIEADVDGDGWIACEGDCDDSDPAVHPDAIEGPESDPTCSDGLDNDCDGSVDGADHGCNPVHVMSMLPDTGIDLCYDDTHEISCPAPGEPFYGQDAQYVTNPMSFTDHGDGTVTDNVTGLMWQQTDDDITRAWQDAIDYCEVLVLAGHTDWRLPDEYELQSIVDYGRYYPAIDTDFFPGIASFPTLASSYWSSSTYAYSPSSAWAVCFSSGFFDYDSKTIDKYVRCVRGETTTQSFTDHGDGTVTDNVTGIMWQQEDDGSTRVWQDALAYCEELDLTGYTDWRLPDEKELRSLVDNTRYTPAIDTTYFPGTNSSCYWSSSHCADYLGYAWAVYFHDGDVGGVHKGYYEYVRCVR